MKTVCDAKKCTSCLACYNICNKEAISIETDSYGKRIPVINENKCISCNICNDVCPVNKQIEKKLAECSYAAFSKDENDATLSSSGGIAAVLSRYIINNDGVVYGSVSTDGTVKHIRTDSIENAELLRGSKYVESNMGNCYKDIISDLKSGKTVLFIGVPCQVAGVRKYTKDRFSNLYTVDLICHGTPPITYLNDYISVICNNSEWDSISFRGKDDFVLNIRDKSNKTIYRKERRFDLYFSAFLKGMIFKDCCYDCNYKTPDRVSDITIGDFWGLDREKLDIDCRSKISVVLLNTEAGKELFENIKPYLYYQRFELSEATNPLQPNLSGIQVDESIRNEFIENYPQMGFYKSLFRTNLSKQVIMAQRKDRMTKKFPIVSKLKYLFLRIYRKIKKRIVMK